MPSEILESSADILASSSSTWTPSKSANIVGDRSIVLCDAEVVGLSCCMYDSGSSMMGLSIAESIGCLREATSSSCSGIESVFVRGESSGIENDPESSGMENDRERSGELGEGPTKESSGLPSSSGSGRDPNLELLDADRPLPLPAVNEPGGDIMKPAGENPPERATELTSTIDEALETCLEIAVIPCVSNKEERRLSERFCSS